MPESVTDVKPEVASSATQTGETPPGVTATVTPPSPDAGLEKVIRDTFNKSESSTDKDETTTPETPAPEAKVEEEVTTTDETQDKDKTETPKPDDKGPVPYERFAEVNKAKVTYETQIAQMQPMVQGYESIVNHCQDNDINPQEFQYWMEIAALAKRNPQEALKQLEPQLTHMKSFVGEVLPKDLQSAVDAGEMTLEWAKKLAAAQAQQTFNAQRGQQLQQQATERQQRAFQQTLVTGLDAWAKNKAATNPDFVPKEDSKAPDGLYEFFIHKLNVMARTAKISSVEDLVITAEEALKSVESSIGRYKSPIKAPVNIRNRTVAQTKPTPIKSLDDAIAAAAAKHGVVMATK
jgi:hypothetical protein